MSDPVTNVEVEDVLSSIRRLVSDNSHTSVKAAAAVAPSQDHLVLKPALHVEPIIQAWSEFGASPEDQGTDSSAASVDDDEAASEFQNPEGVDIANLGDGQSQEDVNEAAVELVSKPFILQPEMDDHADRAVEAELSFTESKAAFFAGQSESLTSKIAALEAAIGKTDDQWEPDDTGDNAYSDTEAPSMKWDYAEEENDAVKIEADTGPLQGAFSQPGDELLDEEALRDIVSEIVREELQGALGERITRNVRRLVRREIYRALVAQDLE